MFRFKLDLEFGRVPEEKPEEPEELLPGGTSGSAQVERAYESEPGLRVGFHRPDGDY